MLSLFLKGSKIRRRYVTFSTNFIYIPTIAGIKLKIKDKPTSTQLVHVERTGFTQKQDEGYISFISPYLIVEQQCQYLLQKDCDSILQFTNHQKLVSLQPHLIKGDHKSSISWHQWGVVTRYQYLFAFIWPKPAIELTFWHSGSMTSNADQSLLIRRRGTYYDVLFLWNKE